MEKKLCKEEKLSKNPFQTSSGLFLRKAIVLNRINAERLKINFQRYVVVQAKTKHERSRQTQQVCSTNISTLL